MKISKNETKRGEFSYFHFYQTDSNHMTSYLLFTKKKILISVFLILISNSYSQLNDTIPKKAKRENAYGFRVIPSVKKNIYGISFGFIGSRYFCKEPYTLKSHGISIHLLSQGLFIPLNHRVFNYKSTFANDTCWMVKSKDSSHYRDINNGILLSGFGTMADVSNGIVLSGLTSIGYQLNGLAINVLSSKYTRVRGVSIALNNEAYDVKGFQIGILNRTSKLKGFQFGLWNCNEKRNLPIINWSF